LGLLAVIVALVVVLPTLLPRTAAQVTAPTIKECVKYLFEVCYSPTHIQNAYQLTPLYRKGYDGRGQTIVIIGAGNPTTLKSDLHNFDAAWGLADPPGFQIVAIPDDLPSACVAPGVAGEDTLDVEWAHAMAPGANIVLLLANSDALCRLRDLAGTIAYVLDHHLGQIISLSYGISELEAGDSASAEHAQLMRAAQEGVTMLAASGDDGPTNPMSETGEVWTQPNVGLPASDPYVLAVGGTILALTDTGDYNGEVAWNLASQGATGGGLSMLYQEPVYQRQVPDQTLFQGQRAIPDVAFTASSALIYSSYAPGELSQVKEEWANWHIVYGTSLSTPCWAGLVAIANQMRGKPLGWLQPVLYALRGRGFHDITSGDNTVEGVSGFQAQPGYDLTTGWGTPIADQLLPALVDEANQLDGSA
jgi:subtilase family serine protease